MRRSGAREITAAVILAMLVVAGCASGAARTSSGSASPAPATASAAPTMTAQDTSAGIGPQYPSTYKRHENPPVLIRNATIMTAAGQEIQGGSILFRDGRIVAVGTNVQAPSDAGGGLLVGAARAACGGRPRRAGPGGGGGGGGGGRGGARGPPPFPPSRPRR